MAEPYLRVCRFRPGSSEGALDADLRARCLALVGSSTGLLALHAGRRNADAGSERILVSVWTDRTALVRSLGAGHANGPAPIETPDDAHDVAVQSLPLALHLRFERPEAPRILRVFRGEVRPGQLEAYVDAARAGTYADASAEHGPHALYLAIDRPSHFLTVSLWSDWSRIEAATGGDIHQPIATRHAERLAGGSASHFELLPDQAAPGTIET